MASEGSDTVRARRRSRDASSTHERVRLSCGDGNSGNEWANHRMSDLDVENRKELVDDLPVESDCHELSTRCPSKAAASDECQELSELSTTETLQGLVADLDNLSFRRLGQDTATSEVSSEDESEDSESAAADPSLCAERNHQHSEAYDVHTQPLSDRFFRESANRSSRDCDCSAVWTAEVPSVEAEAVVRMRELESELQREALAAEAMSEETRVAARILELEISLQQEAEEVAQARASLIEQDDLVTSAPMESHGNIRSIAEEVSMMLDITAETDAILKSGREDLNSKGGQVEQRAALPKASRSCHPKPTTEKERFHDLMRLRPSVSAVARRCNSSAVGSTAKGPAKRKGKKQTQLDHAACGALHRALGRMEMEIASCAARQAERKENARRRHSTDDDAETAEALRRESGHLQARCKDLWQDVQQLQQRLSIGGLSRNASFTRPGYQVPRVPSAGSFSLGPYCSPKGVTSGHFSFPTQAAQSPVSAPLGALLAFKKAPDFDNQSQCSTSLGTSSVLASSIASG